MKSIERTTRVASLLSAQFSWIYIFPELYLMLIFHYDKITFLLFFCHVHLSDTPPFSNASCRWFHICLQHFISVCFYIHFAIYLNHFLLHMISLYQEDVRWCRETLLFWRVSLQQEAKVKYHIMLSHVISYYLTHCHAITRYQMSSNVYFFAFVFCCEAHFASSHIISYNEQHVWLFYMKHFCACTRNIINSMWNSQTFLLMYWKLNSDKITKNTRIAIYRTRDSNVVFLDFCDNTQVAHP